MNNEIAILCDKFGVTAEYLISEYSRYLKITSLIEFAIAIIILILSIRGIYSIHKKCEGGDLFDLSIGYIFLCAGYAIAIVICTITSIIIIPRLIGLMVSPTATVIDYILSGIGGR